MILYICVIVLGAFLTTGVVALFAGTSFSKTFASAWIATGTILLMDAFIATLVRLLPRKIANPDKKIFQVSKREKRFMNA